MLLLMPCNYPKKDAEFLVPLKEILDIMTKHKKERYEELRED